MTCVRTMMPPPPIPWIVLPARRRSNFFDNPLIIIPRRKKTTAIVVIHFLPKALERAAIVGWNTVEARRYDVAAQKASSPDP